MGIKLDLERSAYQWAKSYKTPDANVEVYARLALGAMLVLIARLKEDKEYFPRPLDSNRMAAAVKDKLFTGDEQLALFRMIL